MRGFHRKDIERWIWIFVWAHVFSYSVHTFHWTERHCYLSILWKPCYFPARWCWWKALRVHHHAPSTSAALHCRVDADRRGGELRRAAARNGVVDKHHRQNQEVCWGSHSGSPRIPSSRSNKIVSDFVGFVYFFIRTWTLLMTNTRVRFHLKKLYTCDPLLLTPCNSGWTFYKWCKFQTVRSIRNFRQTASNDSYRVDEGDGKVLAELQVVLDKNSHEEGLEESAHPEGIAEVERCSCNVISWEFRWHRFWELWLSHILKFLLAYVCRYCYVSSCVKSYDICVIFLC